METKALPELVQQMLERDRFAKHAGLRVVRVGGGEAVVEMTIANCHLNALDTVHGGAIFTLADYAFALACNSVHAPSVALSVSIQFLRPGKKGKLTAKAKELETAGKVATHLVEIRDDAGDLVASFQGLAYCLNGPKKPG